MSSISRNEVSSGIFFISRVSKWPSALGPSCFQYFNVKEIFLAISFLSLQVNELTTETKLILIVTCLYLYSLILKRFLDKLRSLCIVALVFPAANIEEVGIVTLSLSLFCLMLLTEVTATALLAVECVVGDKLTHEDEVTQVNSLVKLYMRRFNDGDTITVEPWRSAGFPVIKDCMVDRSAFDKIIQAGGYTSIRTGQAQDANAILIPKENADEAMDCATCIGCGACVAACKNGSAMLFVSSKVSQLALLPQGRPEAAKRAKAMIAKMDELGFGNCTNTRACEAVCPKNESIANIARLNREFLKAKLAD